MIPFWKKIGKHSKPQSAQKRRQNAKPVVPRTAQQSIPMQRMFEDGTCRVKPNYYTRTIAYQDINYQLAQQEDKTAIFEEWCSFLNFFDSSIKFELSFVNMATDSTEFEKSIRIPYQKDGFDDVRAEYSQMLRQQLAKGNNGLTKTKFITFGVEGESMAQVKPRLDHIQNDLLNNFHRLGVQAKPLNGVQRLKLMHDIKKFGALLVSAVLCIGMAAPAFAYEGDTTPVEEPVLPEIVEEEDAVTITDEETGALTPEGNLTLVDDYHTNYSDGSGQQFITMVSKSGATFYLVIDRNAKGQQTVHFMNLVDEADLLALMEEEAAEAYNAEKEAAKQAELDKLKAEEEAKKAAEEAAASDAEQPKENKVTKYAAAFLGVVALIALVAGGGFYFFIQQKHKKQAEKEAADPDADYTEDNGNFEIPPEDDSNDEDTSEEQDVTPI